MLLLQTFFSNLLQALCKPFADLCKPFAELLQTFCKRFANLLQTYADLLQAFCKPCANLLQTFCKPFADLDKFVDPDTNEINNKFKRDVTGVKTLHKHKALCLTKKQQCGAFSYQLQRGGIAALI